MPVAVAAKAGIIVASAACAAAIAIYESPELQRLANDLRRKIGLALQSLGQDILPPNANGEPLFNRPEDAEGFLQSVGVDADDESRRRQREELMYWNAMKLSQELEKQTAEIEKQKQQQQQQSRSSPTSFDDFLQEDKSADEKGSFIFNTGTDVRNNNNNDGLVRRRGLNPSVYANPFADEHGLDYDEIEDEDTNHIAPDKDEIVSQDIYNATPKERPASPITSRASTPESIPAALISIDPVPLPSETLDFSQTKSVSEADSSRDSYAAPEYNQQQQQQQQQYDAYASIQAWAQQQQQQQQEEDAHSNRSSNNNNNNNNRSMTMDFYSPLPITPRSEMSDGELISDGQLTPTTDAASIVDVMAGQSHYYDVMSAEDDDDDEDDEEEDGIPTPAHSWSEVGSVVSESEDGMHQHHYNTRA